MIQKKVCMLGLFGVGKTSLVRRFVQQSFDEKYLTTLGVKVDYKQITLGHATVNLLLWDVAGQEAENFTTASYFRGAHGAVVVYDLTRPDSAQAVQEYCERFLRLAPKAKLILVGNKSDLVEADNAFAFDFTQKPAAHLLASAKTGENVEQAFTKLAQILMA